MPPRAARHLAVRAGRVQTFGNGPRRCQLRYVLSAAHGSVVRHNNALESALLVQALTERAYTVDVVPFNSPLMLREDYDLTLGMGPVVNARALAGREPVIGYITGAPHAVTAAAEAGRIRDLAREQISVDERRAPEEIHAGLFGLSEALLAPAGEWALTHVRRWHDRVWPVRYPALPELLHTPLPARPDADRGFLWFGSSGSVLKGLDILIDLFASGEFGNLTIAGEPWRESSFWRHYGPIATSSPAIELVGRVEATVQNIDVLANRCSFVILPSVSEGVATGVLNCMARGLVPVVTEQVGVACDAAARISEVTREGVGRATRAAAQMVGHELYSRARESAEWVRANHDPGDYLDDVRAALDSVLDE